MNECAEFCLIYTNPDTGEDEKMSSDGHGTDRQITTITAGQAITANQTVVIFEAGSAAGTARGTGITETAFLEGNPKANCATKFYTGKVEQLNRPVNIATEWQVGVAMQRVFGCDTQCPVWQGKSYWGCLYCELTSPSLSGLGVQGQLGTHDPDTCLFPFAIVFRPGTRDRFVVELTFPVAFNVGAADLVIVADSFYEYISQANPNVRAVRTAAPTCETVPGASPAQKAQVI